MFFGQFSFETLKVVTLQTDDCRPTGACQSATEKFVHVARNVGSAICKALVR